MKHLHQRLTPRKLAEPAPSRDIVESAIAAAQAAPDHGRLRPWRFIVLEGESRAALGRIMAESLRRRDANATPEECEKESQKPLRAPLIVTVAAVITQGHKVPEIEQIVAAGCAAQNLQLAFHEAGFGVQWKTGPASRDAYVKEQIGLSTADHIIGFMYVGTVAEPGRAREPVDASRTRYWP